MFCLTGTEQKASPALPCSGLPAYVATDYFCSALEEQLKVRSDGQKSKDLAKPSQIHPRRLAAASACMQMCHSDLVLLGSSSDTMRLMLKHDDVYNRSRDSACMQ